MDDHVVRRASLLASIALLVFGALTTLALVAWFQQDADDLWTWRSILTATCAFAAVTTSALVWRGPTRLNVHAGGAAMAASLLRIGLPQDWTWRTFVLVAVTLILLIPIVHLSIVLKRDDAS